MIYMLLGGFWAVSVTDVVQGGLMSVAAVVLPWVAVSEVGGFGEFLARLQTSSTPDQLSWTAGNAGLVALGVMVGGLSIGFGTYGQPHLLVRFMALRDERALRQARVITIAWYLAVFGGMCLLGLVGRVLHPSIDNPENILFALTGSVFAPLLGAVLITAVLSAIMSTADSQLLVAASAIAHDLGLGRGQGRGSSRAQSSLLISRLTVAVLVIVAVVVAIFLPEGIFSRVLFAWTALGAAFGPTVLLRLAGLSLNPAGILASILTGFALAVAFYLLPNTPGDVLERLGPFCVALAVLLVTRPRSSHRFSAVGRRELPSRET
jgi:Na+/proline symporter